MVQDGAEIQRRLWRDVTVNVYSDIAVTHLFMFSGRGFESRLHKLENEGEKLWIKVRSRGICEKDKDCGMFQCFGLFCLWGRADWLLERNCEAQPGCALWPVSWIHRKINTTTTPPLPPDLSDMWCFGHCVPGLKTQKKLGEVEYWDNWSLFTCSQWPRDGKPCWDVCTSFIRRLWKSSGISDACSNL